MIHGLDKFRAHFIDLSDSFVLIGGVPTWLLLDEAGLDARATRDLDIVLIIEALTPDFAAIFWEFVKAGGYQVCQRSDGQPTFYRFANPHENYPVMLELFTGKEDGLDIPRDVTVTRIPLGEEVSSLSAILLDPDYYEFLVKNMRKVDGLPIADAHCLLPLKAKAWLDLSARRRETGGVDSRNIRKHRSDVLRLSQLLAPTLRVVLPPSITAEMKEFLTQVEMTTDANVLQASGVREDFNAVADRLRAIYGL